MRGPHTHTDTIIRMHICGRRQRGLQELPLHTQAAASAPNTPSTLL